MGNRKKRNVKTSITEQLAGLRQQQFDPEFQIGKPSPANDTIAKIDPILELVENHINHKRLDQGKEYAELIKLISDMSSNVWRIRQKVVDATTGEPIEEFRKIQRPVDKIFSLLEEMGIQVIDRTNQKYITGMNERVLTFEPDSRFTCEVIIETVKPTIIYREKVLQQGEIIVGIPQNKHHSDIDKEK